MSHNLSKNTSNIVSYKKNIIWLLLFILVAVAGLFYVKWSPYYSKALSAAAKHSIGASIISGKAPVASSPSVSTALGYMSAYFKSVWKAVILGLLLGSLIQVAIPKYWIKRALGKKTLGSTAAAAGAALPGMMCSCCAAPVAVGLRKSSASVNAGLAFLLANPTLNPATIVFMGFVLGWKFAFFRVVMGLVLVIGISTLAAKYVKDETSAEVMTTIQAEANMVQENLFSTWLKALLQLIVDTIPAYLIVVAILGAMRAWLFPEVGSSWGNSIIVIIGLAIAGTLFVIPTAAEIPIVQTLMSFGLAGGPAAALIITLPAISLPSVLIVKGAFSKGTLLLVVSGVILMGIVSGLIGIFIF